MELYIGGSHQGKLEYVLRKKQLPVSAVVDGAVCQWEALEQAALVDHAHLLVRRQLVIGADAALLFAHMLLVNPEVILLLDEIGSGLVPVDAFERQYREQTGRLGCWLAARANHVERIFCGLGQVLK